MNRGRVEAITDGIVAIAATIMVLELDIPKGDGFVSLIEQRHVFMAYIISFFMIYFTWYGHHNLFQQIKTLSVKLFVINGVWIFFLTLVPFTTAWLGVHPNSTAPAFIYTLNLLLWRFSFHWLDHQARKDDGDIKKDDSLHIFGSGLIYGGYSLCLLMAFIYSPFTLYYIGFSTILLLVRLFIRRVNKTER